MYKAAVRKLVRHGMDRLNARDPEFLLRLAAPDIEMTFAGDNSWSSMHRTVQKGRTAFVTHRGVDEARSFAERFAAEDIQVEIEDILVNGPPWNTRVAVRAHNHISGPDGRDTYNNRFVDFIQIRWGRMHRFEVYEDTERVARWDEQLRTRAG